MHCAHQLDNVPALVSRMLGETQTSTMSPEALEALPTGLYRTVSAAYAIRATTEAMALGQQVETCPGSAMNSTSSEERCESAVIEEVSMEVGAVGERDNGPPPEECVVSIKEPPALIA